LPTVTQEGKRSIMQFVYYIFTDEFLCNLCIISLLTWIFFKVWCWFRPY